MPDGLTNDERIVAWLASWHPSFAGTAIVNPDFTFRAVNPQFCKILNVTPAELINNKFTDVSPEPARSLDIKNAELVKEGIISSYLMDKAYQFPDGRRVEITLLVKGVYHPTTKEFLFFVSSIMGREDQNLNALSLNQMPTGLLDSKSIIGILTAIALGIIWFMKEVLN